jgi:hypothetical protein
MSRRYGRNQKRRARAEIAKLEQVAAELQAGMEMDRGLLQFQAREINRQQSQLNDVARIMGTNFIGLQPALWKFSDKHQPDYFRCRVNDGDVQMHVMRTHIASAPDRPDYMMHFRVELAGEPVGYAISECALRDGPEDYVVRCIAEEMARLLMSELRKKFGRSRT